MATNITACSNFRWLNTWLLLRLKFIRNFKNIFLKLCWYDISEPYSHFGNSQLTVINQLFYCGHKLNFSNIALIIIQTHGIYEIACNCIVEYTFAATPIQI